jgi:hypothetical protein
MKEKGALRRRLSKLGKKGGPKGGKARMAMLTPNQRRELTQKCRQRGGKTNARALGKEEPRNPENKGTQP